MKSRSQLSPAVGWLWIGGVAAFYYGAARLGLFLANESLLSLQSFVCVIAVTITLLAAALAERRRTGEALKAINETLEERVTERTGQLEAVNKELQDEIAERTQAEEALQASEARFSGILNIAEDAVVSVDEHQRITLFNQGAERIFQYTAQEVLGQPLDLLMPLRFRGMHQRHIAEFAESADVARTMGERRKVFGLRKDGAEFPAEASISKLKLRGKQIFTVMLHDITITTPTVRSLAPSQP